MKFFFFSGFVPLFYNISSCLLVFLWNIITFPVQLFLLLIILQKLQTCCFFVVFPLHCFPVPAPQCPSPAPPSSLPHLFGCLSGTKGPPWHPPFKSDTAMTDAPRAMSIIITLAYWQSLVLAIFANRASHMDSILIIAWYTPPILSISSLLKSFLCNHPACMRDGQFKCILYKLDSWRTPNKTLTDWMVVKRHKKGQRP